MSQKWKEFYCAFCKTQRKIKNQQHVGFFEIGLSLLGSLCLMFLFFQNFDFRFFPIFCIFLVFSEIIIQLGYRLSLSCRHCGFDPVIYKKSPEQAAQICKNYLESRKRDPLTIFSKDPMPKLPVQKKPESPVAPAKKNSQLDLRM